VAGGAHAEAVTLKCISSEEVHRKAREDFTVGRKQRTNRYSCISGIDVQLIGCGSTQMGCKPPDAAASLDTYLSMTRFKLGLVRCTLLEKEYTFGPDQQSAYALSMHLLPSVPSCSTLMMHHRIL